MRTAGAQALTFGDVAEIVADCWQDRLPPSGREILPLLRVAISTARRE